MRYEIIIGLSVLGKVTGCGLYRSQGVTPDRDSMCSLGQTVAESCGIEPL